MSSLASLGRLAWLDYAKGIGIILVVFGHVLIGLDTAGAAQDASWLKPTVFYIYSFHMPLFFVLAGYVFRIPVKGSFSRFLSVNVVGILVPYLIWNVVYAALKSLSPSPVNVPVSLADLPFVILHPVQHFWFLPALFFARLLYWPFARYGGIGGIRAIAAVAILWYLLGSAFGYGTLIGQTLLDLIDTRFFLGLAFFGIGCLVAERVSWPQLARSPVFLAGAAAIWFAVTTLGFVQGYGTYQGYLAPLMALAGVAAVLSLCLLLPVANQLWSRALAFSGEASFAIYISHGVFAAAMRIILLKLQVSSLPVHIVLGLVAGMIGPVVLVILANRVRVSPYLGLGRVWTSAYLPRQQSPRPA